MGFLFAALGAVAGMCLGVKSGLETTILSSIFLSLCLGLAFAKKEVIPFLLGFSFLFLFALAWRFLDPVFGKGEVTGMVSKTGENYYVVRTLLHSYYVSAKGHGYQVGDILRLEGTVKELRMTSYESQFSFASYLEGLGCKGEIVNAKVTEVLCLGLRMGNARKRFLSSFDERTSALLNAILFGRKDYSSSIISSADAIDLLFILSSSGVIYGAFSRLLERCLLTRLKEREASLVVLVVGALLLPLNVEKIGLWRVFLMRLLAHLDVKGRLEYFQRLGLSALILILLDPFNALSSGLWIGGGISLTRYCFSAFLQEKRKLLAFLKGHGFVQLFLLPLTISNGDLHFLSLAYGPALLPLMGLFAFFGVLSFLSVPFTHLLQGYAWMMEGIFAFFGRIDVALPLPPLPLGATFFLYLCLFFGLFLHELGLKRFRNGMILALGAIYCVSLLPAGYLGLQGLYFVNVGQGDCTVIYDRGSAVMIDTGGVVGIDMARETLIPYLRKKRIYHLDALIITHPDYDHYGGRDSLLANFKVKALIEDKDAFPLDIGRLHFENHNVYGGEEANDRSLVLDFNAVGKRVLVTGDAPSEVEKRIIHDVPDIDCDILKVGHHGSDTSTCEAFLDAVTPDIALISCGRRNSYGHPSKTVLERLEARHITIRRTDLEGSVEYTRFV